MSWTPTDEQVEKAARDLLIRERGNELPWEKWHPDVRSKVGDTMHGWKGGAYSIREDCAVFVANHGVMGPRLGLMDDRVILVGDGWDVR